MKFWIDNQLPCALADWIRSKGFECEHVLPAGLAQASDAEICRLAADNIIVSKDQDFFYLASRPGARFQLVWVRIGNCRTVSLLEAFDRAWPMVRDALVAGERIVQLR